jgi:CRP/FNR family transcriptional regulator, cyclic AMP receptor protein
MTTRDVKQRALRGSLNALAGGRDMRHAAISWVPLLQVDIELAQRLPADTLAEASQLVIAPTEWLDPGEWRPEPPAEGDRTSHLGLLVITGFFARRVRVLDRPATELLGPGDLLLPWEPDRTEPFTAGARWEVLEQARVAVLDRRFTALLGRWPDITAALVGRAVSRSRAFALTVAISQLVGVELRLLALLWHVADRWGTPAGDGTALPMHLTHELLGSLISAQRPTVTRALGRLGDDGRVSRRADGLLVVHGEPPDQFSRMRSELT